MAVAEKVVGPTASIDRKQREATLLFSLLYPFHSVQGPGLRDAVTRS